MADLRHRSHQAPDDIGGEPVGACKAEASPVCFANRASVPGYYVCIHFVFIFFCSYSYDME